MAKYLDSFEDYFKNYFKKQKEKEDNEILEQMLVDLKKDNETKKQQQIDCLNRQLEKLKG